MIDTFEDVDVRGATYRVDLRPCDDEALRIAWGPAAPRWHSSLHGYVRISTTRTEWTGLGPRSSAFGLRAAMRVRLEISGAPWLSITIFQALSVWGAGAKSKVQRAIQRGAKWMAARGVERHAARRAMAPRLIAVLRARLRHLEAEARMPEESRAALVRGRGLEVDYCPTLPRHIDLDGRNNATVRARSLDL